MCALQAQWRQIVLISIGGGGGDVEQIVVLGDVMFLCIVEEACY